MIGCPAASTVVYSVVMNRSKICWTSGGRVVVIAASIFGHVPPETSRIRDTKVVLTPAAADVIRRVKERADGPAAVARDRQRLLRRDSSVPVRRLHGRTDRAARLRGRGRAAFSWTTSSPRRSRDARSWLTRRTARSPTASRASPSWASASRWTACRFPSTRDLPEAGSAAGAPMCRRAGGSARRRSSRRSREPLRASRTGRGSRAS